MNKWVGALALACASVQPALAADDAVRPGRFADVLEYSVRNVERGFARRVAQLSEALEQPDATMASTWLSGLRFGPRPNSAVSLSLSGLDVNRARLCLAFTAGTVSQWNEVLQRAASLGLTPANGDCSVAAGFSLAPSTWPATMHVSKTLDRRDVPVATVLPLEPGITGVDAQAVTRPGLTLMASAENGPGEFSIITVSNPLPPEGPEGASLTLTDVAVREGFTVQHTCVDVAPGAQCEVSVRFEGGLSRPHVGSLRLAFSNNAVAIVGLLGRKP